MIRQHLQQLNDDFQQVWTQTKDVERALADWQTKVQTVLDALDPTPQDVDLLQRYLANWQHTMRANKALLIEHQKKISDEIKTGEPSLNKRNRARQFQKN